MPAVYILGGANGTGKTTFYQTAVQQHFIDPHLPFLNIDLIAQKELGSYSAENIAKAELLFRDRLMELIRNGSDFMIESNLAQSRDYDWIANMIKYGYDVVLFFMCTGDVNVNVNRVERRVKEGGHNIPVEIILHRYKVGLSYLKGKLHIFKEVYMIDNATEETIEVAQIINGKLTEIMMPLPVWADELLYIVRKSSSR